MILDLLLIVVNLAVKTMTICLQHLHPPLDSSFYLVFN